MPEAAAHHSIRVLRLRQGEPVCLFNGDGHEYAGRISQISKQSVEVALTRKSSPARESPFPILLAQGISAGEKMDYTLQKAVELGVTNIQPIAAARSVVKLKDDRAEKRVQHWQQVAISACEQCGRNMVPRVAAVAALPNWLAELDHTTITRLILSPTATVRLRSLPPPEGPVALLIGPEGGLTTEEIEMAQRHGFSAVSLGPRILRTETAALATLAAMQALWGDF